MKKTLRSVRAKLRPKYDVSSTFDPEGQGYDYDTAIKSGMKPDKHGHWGSRDGKTGLLLKGRKHKTWDLLEKGEKEAGYRIFKKGKRYYSEPEKH
jgi:hypothetical protein